MAFVCVRSEHAHAGFAVLFQAFTADLAKTPVDIYHPAKPGWC
jgi:hypothetical protein